MGNAAPPTSRAGTSRLVTYVCTAVALLTLWQAFYGRARAQVSPNDGSHIALARALAYDHTTRVSNQYGYTGGIDVAWHAGHYYSDRAPGTGVLGALALCLGRSVYVVPGLAALLAVCCSFLIVRRWCHPWPALLSAAAVAFGTLTWRYSHVFFSHALAEACVLGGVYLALLLADDARPRWWVAALFGWVVGYAVLVEYQLLILTPVLWGYVLAKRHRAGGWRSLRGLWPGLVSWAAAAGLLALYQYVSFGSPWHTSYAYRVGWQEATAFQGDMLTGLWGLLAGEGNSPPGLLTLSPILWLAIWGAFLIRRHPRRAEVALCLALFAAVLLALSVHPSWYGGSTQDTRYLLCVAPLLMLPLGLWIERYLLVPRAMWWRFLGEGLFYVLLFFSIGMNCHDVFYGYNFQTVKSGMPILVTFDPTEVLMGIIAAVPFDRVLWWFAAAGAGAALTWDVVRRLEAGRDEPPQASAPKRDAS